MKRGTWRKLLAINWMVLFLWATVVFFKKSRSAVKELRTVSPRKNVTTSRENISPENDVNLPLIFVGGMPRSGTTLMRTMLESHPDIRCGPETHVIPRLLMQWRKWVGHPSERKRLKEAGLLPGVLNDAMAKFILHIIVKHGPRSKYYCNKDPYVIADMRYLHLLFPMAKFIFMIRDGRASAHSIVSRNVTIDGIDTTSYRDILTKWSRGMEQMRHQCEEIGKSFCFPIQYEQLVLQPIASTKRIFQFLNITWCKEVLHHENHINETKLSEFEHSSEQVRKPLYLDALSGWFGSIPRDVERDMARVAPMLSVLGYDPYNPTPIYGKPDDFVLGKMQRERQRL